jgi:diacylglycerol kinase family enzyme
MALLTPVASERPDSIDQIYVIYNPSSGRGRAQDRLANLTSQMSGRVILAPTLGPGHAEELAYRAAVAGAAVVGAAGGDGTLHEVANGILRAANPSCALTCLPIGSANDYAFAVGLQTDWWLKHEVPLRFRQVDVGLMEAGGKRRYFINGAGLGFNGAVTFESRSIKELQGVWLYSVALLRALWRHYRFPLVGAQIDDFCRVKTPTLAFSASIGKREGNFLLAPQAEVDDGLFDYLHAGPIRWWEVLRHLPGMIRGHLPDDHPALWKGRCREVGLHSNADLIIHLDGELFALPGDGVRNVQITMLPGQLRLWGRFGG